MVEDHGDKIEALFAKFGWEVTNLFRSRYHTDAWCYNLTNALVVQQERIDQLLAALWELRMIAETGSVDDPVWLMPNRIIARAESAMKPDRQRAQDLTAGRMDSAGDWRASQA